MKVRHHHSLKWLWWLTPIVIIAAAVGTGIVFSVIHPHDTSKTPQTAHVTKPAPRPVSISSNDAFFGDVFWGRYMNDWSMASPLKTAYPFSRLNEFHRGDYNAWVANLECPTVAGVNTPSAQMDATLTFNCSPDYLPEAAKWFTAVSLANNHSDNQGADGVVETRQHLDENKIQYFGDPDPTVKENACDVVSWPVTVTYDDQSKKDGQVPIALCGYQGVFQIPPEDSIAVMEQYAKYMPVIVMPHMGVEYTPAPGSITEDTYRSMIDHGADVVIGGHPHWIENTEAYNGHLIVYSMGNFIFDQQANKEVTRSAGIHIEMAASTTDSSSLDKWLQLGKSCGTYHDDCLAQAEQQKLSKLPFTYQFGVIGSDSSDKITKPATQDEMPGILDRLQWNQTMQGLQSPYSALK